MKVIDLLNKIAKGENLPNKVKLECVNSINEHNCFYEFNPIAETYVNGDNQLIQNATCFATLLNLEVEIIGEEPRDIEVCGSLFTRSEYNRLAGIKEDKKIEKIDFENFTNVNTHRIITKINEIIDYINKE